ncbi:MAG TPA: hypothetical protein DEV81_07575 [Cyanobacteria bacterium UBA11049]|nr:hypothetical protein [Cyanobacteria bacterium UBA11049]
MPLSLEIDLWLKFNSALNDGVNLMRISFLTLITSLLRRIILLSLVAFLCLSGISIFTSLPVNAGTEAELKLIPPDYNPSAEEKLDRAYDLSGATGRLEESKQELTNSKENFDPTKRANVKNIKAQAKDSQGNLIEKAKELVEKVTQ